MQNIHTNFNYRTSFFIKLTFIICIKIWTHYTNLMNWIILIFLKESNRTEKISVAKIFLNKIFWTKFICSIVLLEEFQYHSIHHDSKVFNIFHTTDLMPRQEPQLVLCTVAKWVSSDTWEKRNIHSGKHNIKPKLRDFKKHKKK